jgi:hypothetical protein
MADRRRHTHGWRRNKGDIGKKPGDVTRSNMRNRAQDVARSRGGGGLEKLLRVEGVPLPHPNAVVAPYVELLGGFAIGEAYKGPTTSGRSELTAKFYLLNV